MTGMGRDAMLSNGQIATIVLCFGVGVTLIAYGMSTFLRIMRTPPGQHYAPHGDSCLCRRCGRRHIKAWERELKEPSKL